MEEKEKVCKFCCKHNNYEAKFCVSCGKPLYDVCPKCNMPLSSDDPYCKTCGTPNKYFGTRETQVELQTVNDEIAINPSASKLIDVSRLLGSLAMIFSIIIPIFALVFGSFSIIYSSNLNIVKTNNKSKFIKDLIFVIIAFVAAIVSIISSIILMIKQGKIIE